MLLEVDVHRSLKHPSIHANASDIRYHETDMQDESWASHKLKLLEGQQPPTNIPSCTTDICDAKTQES